MNENNLLQDEEFPISTCYNPNDEYLLTEKNKQTMLQSIRLYDEPFNESIMIDDINSHEMKNLLEAIKVKKILCEDLTQDELIELGIFLLNKPLEMRSPNDIQILYKCTTENAFFKKYDKDTHIKCLQNMYCKHYEENQVVFELGSPGTSFYVILKGSVGVKTLITHTKTNEQGELMRVEILTEVRTLKAGDAFGELALMKNGGLRAATIYCKEPCDLAILDKGHFKDILHQKEKDRLSLEIEFFGSTNVFHNCSYYTLKQIYLHSLLITFHRGSVVYKQNDYSDCMYVIKSGEFKLTKNLVITEEDEQDEMDNELNRFLKRPKQIREIEIVILTAGEVFGVEELNIGSKRQHNVTCISVVAEAYNISKEHYQTKVLLDPKVSNLVGDHITAREKIRSHRLESIEEQTIKHKNYIMTPSSLISKQQKLLKKVGQETKKDNNNNNKNPDSMTLLLDGNSSNSKNPGSRMHIIPFTSEKKQENSQCNSSNSIDNLIQNTEQALANTTKKYPFLSSRNAQRNASSPENSKELSNFISPRYSNDISPRQKLDGFSSVQPPNIRTSNKFLKLSKILAYSSDSDLHRKQKIIPMMKGHFKVKHTTTITSGDFLESGIRDSFGKNDIIGISKRDGDSPKWNNGSYTNALTNIEGKPKLALNLKEADNPNRKYLTLMTTNDTCSTPKFIYTRNSNMRRSTIIRQNSKSRFISPELPRKSIKYNSQINTDNYDLNICLTPRNQAKKNIDDMLFKTLRRDKIKNEYNDLGIAITNTNNDLIQKTPIQYVYNKAVITTSISKNNDHLKNKGNISKSKPFMNIKMMEKLAQKSTSSSNLKQTSVLMKYIQENIDSKTNNKIDYYYTKLLTQPLSPKIRSNSRNSDIEYIPRTINTRVRVVNNSSNNFLRENEYIKNPDKRSKTNFLQFSSKFTRHKIRPNN